MFRQEPILLQISDHYLDSRELLVDQGEIVQLHP